MSPRWHDIRFPWRKETLFWIFPYQHTSMVKKRPAWHHTKAINSSTKQASKDEFIWSLDLCIPPYPWASKNQKFLGLLSHLMNQISLLNHMTIFGFSWSHYHLPYSKYSFVIYEVNGYAASFRTAINQLVSCCYFLVSFKN